MKASLKQARIVRPNSDGKRELIIGAALRVMISDGLYNATTRKIAEAAGVNLATLHYHFNDKEEVFFLAMGQLVTNYRKVLATRFMKPQTLHDRIPELLYFIWEEIEKAPDEQLALQEMTLYLLRHPHAATLARDKDHEFLSLYEETLLTSTDADSYSPEQIKDLANFIYTGLVGAFNQWLATRDKTQILKVLASLIGSAQHIASAERR
ncbi:transcriptional regulator, TetR family [Ensifer adhaerens]|nr:transcriptional regulator, TetR family [Ensifer adhaerens]